MVAPRVSDLSRTCEFHRGHGALATLTAVQPPGRFGTLDIDGDSIRSFHEKPRGDGAWINGGYFVLSPRVGEYIEGDATVWEEEPVERLARDGQLRAYRHAGFWRAMDTVRDRNHLEELWRGGRAPWRQWA